MVPVVPVPDVLKSLGLESIALSAMRTIWPKNSCSKVNRYLAREQARLAKMAIHNPVAFWKRASFLISHSDAFLFAALRHVRPKWYEGDSFLRVIDWLRSAARGRQAWKSRRGLKSYHPIIAALELDKPDGSKRVISSPKVQGRLLLFLWNHFLGSFLEPRLPSNFHGHRKGYGVSSAWEDVLEAMNRYDNIWEFDLVKFHDSISQATILESLLQTGMPIKVAKDILNLCRAQTILDCAEVKRLRVKQETALDPGEVYLDSGPAEGNAKFMQIRGTPQGVATSGIIATWALYHIGLTTDPAYHYVGYADDGLVMSNNPDPDEWMRRTLNSPVTGISVQEAKCRWLKKDGEWLSDLQFLGLRYDPQQKRVYASSKKGLNEGLYFSVGDDWLAWMSRIDVKDLEIKESPRRKGEISPEDKLTALSPDRLRNLPVAIARLFWPGEMLEAFSDDLPPWPFLQRDALKVLFRGMYEPSGPYQGTNEESSFFWHLLLTAFSHLTDKDEAREPHTRYYPRNERACWAPDLLAQRGVIYLYRVDPQTGKTTMGLDIPKARPGVRGTWGSKYMLDYREQVAKSPLTLPRQDFYRCNWVTYRAPVLILPYRDKWATVARATEPSRTGPSELA